MKKVISFMMLALVLSACGDNGSEPSNEPAEVEMIEANLQVPKEGITGEKVSLQVEVTQGEETVTDAEEVVFEIWPTDNKEASEKVTASLEEDAYVATYTFDSPGSFSVQSHVTARGLHTMPIKEISITGDGNSEETAHKEGHDHSSSETNSVSLQLSENEYTANEEATFTVEASQGEKRITGANVSLEIATPDNETHAWVDLEETDKGYQGVYTFKSSGQATITIHYKKGDAHDHSEVQVEVK
ncbi:FixH family protein [Radiobacillus deserti]|uniref:YtkA-like domain-containing protein n=1 Tax=Radiobacillus deserti TaxID=2594883 RepID=A0A516KIN6_9BACI|nr:FixH family protein [Radiobacillus deserti]QDP41255.1 hypothetical protein FN924_14325 [Radiobacillus deserti]